MNEVKDPEIKLFGKKIALPENGKITTVGPGGSSPGNISAEEQMNTCLEQNKVGTAEEVEGEEKGETEKIDSADKASEEELRENKQQEDDDQDQIDGNNPQQKTLNKPDKILPCPRCNSKDTKFCYFNNYNANQPRYFCKTCQRYWTAGGTMRNMPVGAGRRKTKNLASNFRHISISQALREACFDSPDLICHHPSFKINGSTVLSFASSHEKKKGGENGGDFSTKSSVRTSNLAVESGRNGAFAPKVQTVMHGFPSPMQCLPPIPWPYPFPPIYPSGIPVPFFPSPYWNCGFPGPWTIPWPCHPNSNSNSNSNSTSNSNSPSPTLGKHPRDGDLNESRDSKKSEASILVPKTLRIDDPDEAVRSSIWTTLGIKNEFSRGSIFKGFQSNGEEKKEKDRVDMSSPVLKANPAALSRSLSFQEN